jgi:hypothetical protein
LVDGQGDPWHPKWRRLQESGTHATFEESAAAEKINASYVGRVL